MLIESLREMWNDLERLDKQIADIERRLQTWMKEDKACHAIAAIPGVGLLTATAVVSTMGDPKAFRSGREFAAWLGLVPGQTGTGGKIQLLGISKRGDTYVAEHCLEMRCSDTGLKSLTAPEVKTLCSESDPGAARVTAGYGNSLFALSFERTAGRTRISYHDARGPEYLLALVCRWCGDAALANAARDRI
jgi:hypothetical protein